MLIPETLARFSLEVAAQKICPRITSPITPANLPAYKDQVALSKMVELTVC